MKLWNVSATRISLRPTACCSLCVCTFSLFLGPVVSLLLLAAAQRTHYYDSAGTQRPLQRRVAYSTALWRVLLDKSDAVYHPAAALRNLVVGPVAEEVRVVHIPVLHELCLL
jgi:hypothetical protein